MHQGAAQADHAARAPGRGRAGQARSRRRPARQRRRGHEGVRRARRLGRHRQERRGCRRHRLRCPRARQGREGRRRLRVRDRLQHQGVHRHAARRPGSRGDARPRRPRQGSPAVVQDVGSPRHPGDADPRSRDPPQRPRALGGRSHLDRLEHRHANPAVAAARSPRQVGAAGALWLLQHHVRGGRRGHSRGHGRIVGCAGRQALLRADRDEANDDQRRRPRRAGERGHAPLQAGQRRRGRRLPACRQRRGRRGEPAAHRVEPTATT